MKKLIFATLLFLISIAAESQFVEVPWSVSLDLDNPPEYISNKKFYHGGKDYLTIGGYLKGKKHGTFLYFIKINNGVMQLAKEETYINGELDGYYRSFIEGAEDGYYKKGIKDSVWTRSRNDEYEKVEYKNGVRNGIYEFIDYDLEDKIVGQYKNDKKEGIWTKESSLSIKSVGPYKNDKKEGIWTETLSNRKSFGLYRNDKKEGIWTTEKSVGKHIYKSFGPYKDGKKEGIWTETDSFFKSVGLYKDGKKEGIWTEIDSILGHKDVGQYKNDKKEGIWTTTTITTQSTSIIEEYRNGELVPTETLHEEK